MSWINLTPEECALITASLASLHVPLAKEITEKLVPVDDSKVAHFIEAAQEIYSRDEVEIDGEPVVSVGDDGAFVMAWVWVRHPDTEIDDDDEEDEE